MGCREQRSPVCKSIHQHAHPPLLLMSGTADEGSEPPSEIAGEPGGTPASSALQHSLQVKPAWQISRMHASARLISVVTCEAYDPERRETGNPQTSLRNENISHKSVYRHMSPGSRVVVRRAWCLRSNMGREVRQAEAKLAPWYIHPPWLPAFAAEVQTLSTRCAMLVKIELATASTTRVLSFHP